MRVFGKQYNGNDVYIKIRVELISTTHANGENFIFVMSFHYSEWNFTDSIFPYKNGGNMKTIKIETKLCLMCMEEHEVQTVILEDKEEFKGKQVVFNAMYEYCSKSNEYLETQEMIKSNSLSMKDAYREKVGLLT